MFFFGGGGLHAAHSVGLTSLIFFERVGDANRKIAARAMSLLEGWNILGCQIDCLIAHGTEKYVPGIQLLAQAGYHIRFSSTQRGIQWPGF